MTTVPTITASYPCCGRRCVVPNTPALPSETVERKHWCDPADETGTTYAVSRHRLVRDHGIEANVVEFFDLASDEAFEQYGVRRIPRRSRP